MFITLGFYTAIFNIIRQVYALSILCIAYQFLINKENKKFFLAVLVASLFHQTAIIFSLIYFLKEVRITSKICSIYLLISGVFFIFGRYIIQFLMRFGRIQYEINYDGGEMLLIFLLLILIFSLYYKPSVNKIGYDLNILYHLQLIGLLVQILALNFSIFTRIGIYFRFFLIIIIPCIISLIKNKKEKILLTYGIIIIMGIFYIYALINDLSSITPYSFFWDI